MNIEYKKRVIPGKVGFELVGLSYFLHKGKEIAALAGMHIHNTKVDEEKLREQIDTKLTREIYNWKLAN